MGQGSEPEWMQAVDAPLRFQGTLETWDEAISSKKDIQDLGVGYFNVNVDDEFLLQVEADTNTRWRVIDLESGTNYGLEEPIRLQGPVSVAVVNLGPEDLDPDEHCSAFCAFEGRSMSLWIEKPIDVEDSGQLDDSGGLEDTGLEPEEPRAGACACASSSKNSQLGGFGMSVLLGLFWRRRR